MGTTDRNITIITTYMFCWFFYGVKLKKKKQNCERDKEKVFSLGVKRY